MPAAVPEAVPRYPGDVDEPNAGTVSPRLLVWREIRIVRGRRCTAAGGDVSYELLQFIGVLGAVCENDGLNWPHCDVLNWPHLGVRS